MNKIIRFLFSSKLSVVLLLVFALAMAVATFIENDFGTQTARTLIYNALWFEIVMLLLAINFLGNIFKYRLYRKEKYPVFLFHLAFIVILIGAAITRYLAYEGVMRIREGQSSNIIISDRNYIQLHASDGKENIEIKDEKYFSPLQSNLFELRTSLSDKNISVKYKDFIADAVLELQDNQGGDPILHLVVSTGDGKENLFLKKNENAAIGAHQHVVAFDKPTSHAANISESDGELTIQSEHPIETFSMDTQVAGRLSADTIHPLKMRTLYRMGDFSFVPKAFHKSGKLTWKSGAEKPKDNKDTKDDILVAEVTVGNQTEDIEVLYRHGFLPISNTKTINDVSITLAYGAIPITAPFKVQLNDFQLERYPGSTSPSSYASEVTVIDQQEEMPFRIYMNHVLDYKGYRFFQASYDTDEKGTVLAVNHDRPGTIISYLGYLLMGLGMLWTLFGRGSRFSIIQRKLKKLKVSQQTIVIFLIMLGATPVLADNVEKPLDSIIENQIIDQTHAALFGRLLVQDLDGRIKPINSLASEFLRKVSRKNYYKSNSYRLDANQVFLAIHADPATWSKIPLIKIDKRKGGELFQDIRTNSSGLASFNEFIKSDGNYILEKAVKEANAKKPAERSEFDKEIITVDERFNILYNVLAGNYLKIFPLKGDTTKTWYSFNHDFTNFSDEDAHFARGIVPLYFMDIASAKKTGAYTEAENRLAYIKKYQKVLAQDIIPSPEKIEAELWYNQLNLYFWLFQVYFVFGLLLLTTVIIKIFVAKKWINHTFNGLVILTLIAFILHTGNLILRWYVADHAPWSNGYEMITFVAWSLMLFGIVFYKKSDFALPLATLFAGTLLFVSYLDWLNPEITNLMPVLKSYWLKIHVATIISSYAPLALSALLGLMALLLMIFRTENNKAIINIKIKELSYINELSMTIGVFILAIGTFLGGIWANESWGRYWAWDPKETWALISIIIYAAVLHFHFIPKMNNRYVLNVSSVVAFFSIIMTSFGVNYYLTGLHSYATGDPVPIPKFIYIVVAIIFVIFVLAYRKFYTKNDAK